MAMNGPFLRGDDAWMKRARISFPVPDSPCRHVVTSVAATRAARLTASHHPLDLPTGSLAHRGSGSALKSPASTVITTSRAHGARTQSMAPSRGAGSSGAQQLVRGGGDVRGKETFETGEVAILGGDDERFEQTLPLGR